MTDTFNFSTQFTLDKPYFQECYEQSVNEDHSWRAYAKAMFFCGFGAALLLFTEVIPYAAWFVFVLGLVEALSVYYQKPWWVARQLLGKSAKGKVNLTIDDIGITTESFYINETIQWPEIKTIVATEKGWIIEHSKGKNYLSNGFLSEQVDAYLSEKAKAC